MYLMSGPANLLVILFLFLSMLSIGMQAGVAEMRMLARSRGFLVRVLVANFVLAPLVGVALAKLLPIAPAIAGTLVLLACTPGGLTSLQFTSKVKGTEILAAASLVMLALLALLLSPLMLRLFLPRGIEFGLPYGKALGVIALLMLAPLWIGRIIRGKAPTAAPKLARIIAIVGALSFVGYMVLTKSFRKEALGSLGAPAVGAMALFFGLSMLIGWLMGGPARETRQILATTTSMRNVAVCLAIASSSPAGSVVVTPLIGFSLLMVTPNMLFTIYHAIRRKRAAKRTRDARS